MKKHMLRFLSFLFSLLLILQIPLAEVSALDFVSGSNSASSSYKSGKYYENLTSVQLTGDGRTDVLAVALSQLGYQEGAENGQFSGLVSGSSNYTEFNYNFGDWGSGYGGGNYPWCAAFVSFCLLQAKTHSLTKMTDWCRAHVGDKNYIWREISCNQWANQLRTCGYFKDSKSNGGSYIPQSGDLIFFADGGVGKTETHIGFVLYSDNEKVYTVEGNTSSGDGLVSNGGGVYLKSYALDRTYIRGYGVLPYEVNSSVPHIDYSGVNVTPGVYAASTNKYVYETENATEYKWLLERGSMFTVTEICSNGRVKAVCKIGNETVTGYIMNNTDRIVQLSAGGEYITHISVTTLPSKLTYMVGDSFNPDGMVVTAFYNTGKTETVSDYSLSGYTASEGTKTITVTSGDRKATFEVVVERDTLTKIEVTTLPSKTVYYVGEEFEKAGMVVTATFEDGSTREVTDYTVSGYSSTEGYKRLTVKYGSKSTSFMVTVKAAVIEKIEITTLPDVLEYKEGETPSLDGMIVFAVYSDGTKKAIEGFSIKSVENKDGKGIVTIVYDGFEASYEITFKAKEHIGTVTGKKEPTCSREGYTGDTVCADCGEVLQKGTVLPKKEHTRFVTGETESTCKAEGYTGDTVCISCGEVLQKGTAIAKKEHSKTVTGITNATCGTEGYTGDTVCTVCGELIEKGKVVEKTAHSKMVTGITYATCNMEGYTGDTVCSYCGELIEKGKVVEKTAHSKTVTGVTTATCSREGYTGDMVCLSCGNVIEKGTVVPKTEHTKTVTGKTEATCSKEGYTGDTICTDCGEVLEKGKAVVKKDHTVKTNAVKATPKKNGSVTKKCSVCGEVIAKTTIYKIKTVKLEKASYIYNGKNPAITVVVKDSKGKKLKKNTDYKIKVASSRKKVGTYKVTVTFKGKYKGEKELIFKVLPKNTSISKLTGDKKSFTVKWKKQTKEITGYEIQYSTSKKFTKKTTKTFTAKSKATSNKVEKLKSMKTYYVRIRTYKTVKGEKIYSAWSSVKSVKTK